MKKLMKQSQSDPRTVGKSDRHFAAVPMLYIICFTVSLILSNQSSETFRIPSHFLIFFLA